MVCHRDPPRNPRKTGTGCACRTTWPDVMFGLWSAPRELRHQRYSPWPHVTSLHKSSNSEDPKIFIHHHGALRLCTQDECILLCGGEPHQRLFISIEWRGIDSHLTFWNVGTGCVSDHSNPLQSVQQCIINWLACGCSGDACLHLPSTAFSSRTLTATLQSWCAPDVEGAATTASTNGLSSLSLVTTSSKTGWMSQTL